jgi:hypothetical protein
MNTSDGTPGFLLATDDQRPGKGSDLTLSWRRPFTLLDDAGRCDGIFFALPEGEPAIAILPDGEMKVRGMSVGHTLALFETLLAFFTAITRRAQRDGRITVQAGRGGKSTIPDIPDAPNGDLRFVDGDTGLATLAIKGDGTFTSARWAEPGKASDIQVEIDISPEDAVAALQRWAAAFLAAGVKS